MLLYKSLSQCLYGSEIYHFSIRQKIYESLHKKKDQYNNNGITINIGNINTPIKEYIEKIQNRNFWAGDLELSESTEIYKINIIIYKLLKRDGISAELSFYNIYGNIYNNNSNILLALINNDHYNIINFSKEKNTTRNNNSIMSNLKFDNVINDLNNKCCENKELSQHYYYNLSQYNKNGLIKKTELDYPSYPNVENSDTFYNDIIEYLKSTVNYLKHDTTKKDAETAFLCDT